MDTTDTKAKTSMKKTLLNFGSFGSFVVSVLMLSGVSSHAAAQPPAASIHAARIPQNPLITVKSSPTLGDNVNGPAIIRVPSWVEHPLGRYYMYFAHHMGTQIRLAYADAITGPWHVYEPGVLEGKDTAFYRPRPDPPENLKTSTRTSPRPRSMSMSPTSACSCGRMVDQRGDVAGPRACGTSLGARTWLCAGHAISRVRRRPALHGETGHFTNQLPAGVSERRLLLW